MDTKYCAICGYPANGVHHLIFGSDRKKADKDKLYIPICDRCHVTGELLFRIHDNPMAELLSKMLGQALFEKNYYKDLYYELRRDEDEARDVFIQRYGRNFLP